MSVSGDGLTLAAGNALIGIRFWDLATARERPETFAGLGDKSSGMNQYRPFVLAPDAKTVLIPGNHRSSGMALWDTTTGAERVLLAAGGDGAAFSPDGKLVVVLHLQEAHLMSTTRPITVHRIQVDSIDAHCAAFSPDGKTLATAGDDRTVHLWETLTGISRGQFAGHEGRVGFVAFSPDRRRLASSGTDQTVLIWDLNTYATPGPSTATDRDELWTELAGADAEKAFRAIVTLALDAEQAVPFLQTRLKLATPVEAKHLARLIADLDSEVFAERQRASAELAKLGERVTPALRAALGGKISPEFRRRLEDLLHATLRAAENQPPTTEQIRQLRSIEILERAGTPAAQKLLKTLAVSAPGARVTEDARAALSRLAQSSP